jgi:hypothetical protein
MTANVEEPNMRREQMAIDLHNSKKDELIEDKAHHLQELHDPEGLLEFPDEFEEQDLGMGQGLDTLTGEHYLKNP